MANEIRLPDIGDFKDVPIIEILVAPGQSVRKDEPILTLESDKASMDVPAPEDGVIGEIRVKVGDKVSQGDVLATYAGGRRGEAGRRAAAPKRPRRRAQGGGVEIQEPAPKPPRPRSAAEARGRPGRAGRFRGRYSGSGRRSRRLHRRLPRRRSRAERRSGRLATDARRRVPQRRLHPVQGAAACRQGHRRRQGDGLAWGELRRADLRPCGDPRLEGWRGQAPDRRPRRAREAAQGQGGDRRGQVHLAQHACASRPRRARGSCASTRRSSPPAPSRPRRGSSPPTRASGIRPGRSRSVSSPSACWSSAEGSSASRWRRSIMRSAPASP